MAASSDALRNVEVKARVPSGRLDALLQAARTLANAEPEELQQRDVFFPLESGRLKLRRCNQLAKLIWYSRDDCEGAKLSQYRLLHLQPEQVEPLEQLLTAALGCHPPLCKTRQLFLVGQTRIHVDKVEGLGDFMELEVVLRPDQTLEDGQKIVDFILGELGVKPEDLLSGAYLDLLMKLNAKE